MGRILFLILLINFAVLSSYAQSGLPQNLQLLSSPQPAPEFALADLQDKLHYLSDYQGQTVLIHFWATWCLPCRQELPAIQKLSKLLATNQVTTLAVAADSHQAVESFSADLSHMTVLIDQYGSALHAYRVKGLPATYIVSKKGRIEAIAIGSNNWNSPASLAILKKISE
jgi:thiol-disulfide isomerase/thioredoxin